MCVKECKRGCHLDEYPGKLPLYLTIFWWNCEDECKYQCMYKVSAANLKSNKTVQQFYGKVSSVWNLWCNIDSQLNWIKCIICGDSMVKWLRHQTANPSDSEFKTISDHQMDLFQLTPWFKSLAVLVHSQLVCLLPVRILNLWRLFDSLL